MRNLSFEEVKDILVGCTILGTGGGGALDDGISAVSKAFKDGKEFRLLDFSEIKDDKYYINPYFCGAIMPQAETPESVEEMPNELTLAINALEKYMNTNFDGVISIEYGGGNTGEAMAAAAIMGKYIVDCDAAGRAVPELQFSTYYVRDRPIYPFCVATKFGDVAIFPYVASDARAEALSRYMAIATDGTVGMADHPISGKLLKDSVIPSALSYAGNVGKAQRKANDAGDDPIKAIIDAGNGILLFEGTVTSETNWALKEGFTVGEVYLSGINNFINNEMKIWYKNENMICSKNGEIYVTCPDLICVVELKTGYPITNPNCEVGQEIAVLGFECHELWKTEKGLSILNPRFFGFDTDCKFLKDII